MAIYRGASGVETAVLPTLSWEGSANEQCFRPMTMELVVRSARLLPITGIKISFGQE